MLWWCYNTLYTSVRYLQWGSPLAEILGNKETSKSMYKLLPATATSILKLP